MGNFTFKHLEMDGVVLVHPRKFGDMRGYFMETYSAADYAAGGIGAQFVQDNQSLSAQPGTIRGLHFQVPPKPQAKLVRVLAGAIFDVAVDLRRSSPTYGKWCAATLTADGGEQLFVPRGFAHAFCTLADNTLVAYKVDGYYAPDCDAGLIWNDRDIGIVWPPEAAQAVTSEKDAKLPRLRDFSSPFE